MNYTWLIVCILIFVFCLFALNFSRIKAFFFNLKFFKKPKKQKEKKNKDTKKLTFNENQIRPILRPPVNKEDEGKKEQIVDGEKVNVPEVDQEVKLEPDNVLKFSNLNQTRTNKFKTRAEIDKEFEDIKNFLNLPSGIGARDKFKSSSDKFSSNEKTIPEFKEPIKVEGINRAKNYGLKQNNFVANEDFLENREPYFKVEDKKNIIRVDGDEIDLNKLPAKMRKLLIMNILARKDFD